MSDEDVSFFDSRLSQSLARGNKGPARIDHVVDDHDSCPNSANGTVVDDPFLRSSFLKIWCLINRHSRCFLHRFTTASGSVVGSDDCYVNLALLS